MLEIIQRATSNARAAAHVLLFTVLPESFDLEVPGTSGNKGNVTAWFPFWGMVIGFFAYGLILTLIRSLSFAGISHIEMYALGIAPISGMAFMAPTFAAWLGKPARKDGLASAISGLPSLLGYLIVAFMLFLCLILEISIFQTSTAFLFFGLSLLIAAVVPHIMNIASKGTVGATYPIASIVAGIIQLVIFTMMVI